MTKREKLKKIPVHLGLIIDGNGRWAKQKGLVRSMGHKAGLDNLQKIIKECFYVYGVKHISVYCFSTENWNRPDKEVEYLSKLFRKWIDSKLEEKYPDVRINFMGDFGQFGEDVAQNGKELMERTKHKDKFVLNLGINYSGQEELVMAINKIIDEKIERVDRDIIANHLYTAGQPPVDLLIRTSGEQRISNFMLWQLAYAEMYFPKKNRYTWG